MTGQHPARQLALIVALLAMLAPFSIDTYLPSFPDIAREFGASDLYLQQTLSLYLLAFAVMTLVYGPLADAFGRRVVVLGAVAVFVASSVGCMLATDAPTLLAMRVGQGLSASAGMVVGRAVIRDVFAGAQAQRVMAQMMLTFAIAPAIAPIVGGWLHDAFGWRSVFAFLALLGFSVWLWTALRLPETLPEAGRQSIHPRDVARSYWRALTHGRFVVLVVLVAANFGGIFLYIAASPTIIYRHLGLGVDDFWRLFVPVVGGMMLGTFISGRVAGRLTHAHAVDIGYGIMLAAAALNVACALWVPVTVWSAVAPTACYAVGMALAMPNLSLMALDIFPAHRGLASALQGFGQTSFNALVAGLLAPLVSATLAGVTLSMLVLCVAAFALWRVTRHRHLLPASADLP
jgi:DHA1 family bicyclomycin/chloramphenicol resistance-like MFS transporter